MSDDDSDSSYDDTSSYSDESDNSTDESYTESSTTSYGQGLINAFGGVILGVLMFIGAFPLIFWNEGRSVQTIKNLDEGRSVVVAVPAESINAARNSKLIHTSGRAVTNSIVKDPLFGVSENALKLKRTVEMYQWQETKKEHTEQNFGGSKTTKTTYTYNKVWSETPIDSSGFKKREKHNNPSMPYYKSEEYVADPIKLGAFTLSGDFVTQINNFEAYPLSPQKITVSDEAIKESFTINGDTYTNGNINKPRIGDIRVRYAVVKPTQISVIGKQVNNDSIQKYYTKHGEISLLAMGSVAHESMFKAAEEENTMLTWIVRLGSFLLLWFGLAAVLKPISALADVIPFLGSVIEAGLGVVTGLAALIICLSTIAVAWLYYRPLIGLTLLLLAAGFLFGGFELLKQKINRTMHRRAMNKKRRAAQRRN